MSKTKTTSLGLLKDKEPLVTQNINISILLIAAWKTVLLVFLTLWNIINSFFYTLSKLWFGDMCHFHSHAYKFGLDCNGIVKSVEPHTRNGFNGYMAHLSDYSMYNTFPTTLLTLHGAHKVLFPLVLTALCECAKIMVFRWMCHLSKFKINTYCGERRTLALWRSGRYDWTTVRKICLGPLFFDGPVNNQSYLAVLREWSARHTSEVSRQVNTSPGSTRYASVAQII
jgi:hypothetical protein